METLGRVLLKTGWVGLALLMINLVGGSIPWWLVWLFIGIWGVSVVAGLSGIVGGWYLSVYLKSAYGVRVSTNEAVRLISNKQPAPGLPRPEEWRLAGLS